MRAAPHAAQALRRRTEECEPHRDGYKATVFLIIQKGLVMSTRSGQHRKQREKERKRRMGNCRDLWTSLKKALGPEWLKYAFLEPYLPGDQIRPVP